MGEELRRDNVGQMPSHAVVTSHDVASAQPIMCRTTEVRPSSHGVSRYNPSRVTRYSSRRSAVNSAVNEGLYNYKHWTVEGTVSDPQDESLRE